MAGRTPGKSVKKKTTRAKTKTRAVKSRTAKPNSTRAAKKNVSADKSPIYILSIMVLLIIVIFMLIRNFNSKDNRNTASVKETKEVTVSRNSKNTDKNKTSDSENVNKKETSKEKNTGENSREKNNKKIISENDDSSDKSDNKERDQKEYYIYLLKLDQKSEKISVRPVKRQGSGSPLQSSLKELIKGPDRNEKKNGFISALPEDLKIRNIKIVGRNAVIDLNDAIETNANGEILLTRIDQLVYTATQFDGIDGIIIKINGKEKKFLGGEGLSISGPIQRRRK
jgi:spore germination protein GerM